MQNVVNSSAVPILDLSTARAHGAERDALALAADLGLTLVESLPAPDLGGQVHVFKHTSGLTFSSLHNNCRQNRIQVHVRTPHKDHSGVFHIAEHCLITGENAGLIQPYFQLSNSLIHSGIKALTSHDQTIYAFQSSHKESLTIGSRTFLECTLRPEVSEAVFLRERGYYQGAPGKSGLHFSGVVYNEVQGISGEALRRNNHAFNRAFLPNSCHAFEVGGSTAEIPSLSFQRFSEIVRKYYIPANTVVVMAGELSLRERLEILAPRLAGLPSANSAGNILTAELTSTGVAWPEAKSARNVYPSNATTSGKDLEVLFLNYNLPEHLDSKALSLILAITEHLDSKRSGFYAPLLAKDSLELLPSFTTCSRSELQFVRTFFQTSDRAEQEFLTGLTERVLKSLRDSPLPVGYIEKLLQVTQQKIIALPSSSEFGQVACNRIAEWNFGFSAGPDQDSVTVRHNQILDELHGNKRSFADLVDQIFVSNPQTHQLLLVPSVTEYKELKAASDRHTVIQNPDMATATIAIQQHVKVEELQRRATESSAGANIRLGDLSAARDLIVDLPQIEFSHKGVNIRHFPVELQGERIRLSMEFPIQHLDTKGLQLATTNSEYVFQVGATSTTPGEFVAKRDRLTSDFNVTAACYLPGGHKQAEQIEPSVNIRCRLDLKIGDLRQMLDMISASIQSPDYRKVQELWSCMHDSYRQAMRSQGNTMSLSSYALQLGAEGTSHMQEYLSAMAPSSMARFLLEALSQNRRTPNNLVQALENNHRAIFHRGNVNIDLICAPQHFQAAIGPMANFIEALPEAPAEFIPTALYRRTDKTFNARASLGLVGDFPNNFITQRLIIPGGIENREMGTARMAVALLGEYLNTELRTKGAAYAAQASLCPFLGQIALISHQDPGVQRTLQIFRNIGEFLVAGSISENEIQSARVSNLRQLFSYGDAIDRAENASRAARIHDTTEQQLERVDAILSTSRGDLRRWGEVLLNLSDADKSTVAIGNQSSLDAAQRAGLIKELAPLRRYGTSIS